MTTTKLTDTETIEALRAKCALLSASLKQAEREADELRAKLAGIDNNKRGAGGALHADHGRLGRELRRCSSFVSCARTVVQSTNLTECDEANDLLLEVQNRLDRAAETLDPAEEEGGAA